MPSETQANSEVLDVAGRVARAFASLQIRYALVGSLASSLRGDPRSTNDIDFVSSLRADQVPAFAEALGEEFEVDQQTLQDAIRRRDSWNIFFLPWMIKVDLFALDTSELQRTQLARAVPTAIEGQEIVVLSADDVVLSKLLWYRAGGGVSDQQWRDVVGVLRVSPAQIDESYMREWAARLGLDSLLARALAEAVPRVP